MGIEGTLVGVVPDPHLADAAAHLDKGDSLVFYTDGVTEARNETGMLGENSLRDPARLVRGPGRRLDRGDDRGRRRGDAARGRDPRRHRGRCVAGPQKCGESSEKWVITPSNGIGHRHERRSIAPGRQGGFRLSIGGGAMAAGRARRELARLRTDLDPPLLESVRLLVTELVTNSVRHAGRRDGRAGRAGGQREACAWRSRTRARRSSPSCATRTPTRDDGWGLFLVDRLSDSLGVVDEDAGTQRVWFEVRRTS